jgi:AmiR/NasT family two-component response regulator
VLQGSDSAAALKRQLEALQEQLRDRHMLTQAKARLEAIHRRTEEQAYLHLRGNKEISRPSASMAPVGLFQFE